MIWIYADYHWSTPGDDWRISGSGRRWVLWSSSRSVFRELTRCRDAKALAEALTAAAVNGPPCRQCHDLSASVFGPDSLDAALSLCLSAVCVHVEGNTVHYLDVELRRENIRMGLV
jgi:hypothetical protein